MVFIFCFEVKWSGVGCTYNLVNKVGTNKEVSHVEWGFSPYICLEKEEYSSAQSNRKYPLSTIVKFTVKEALTPRNNEWKLG